MKLKWLLFLFLFLPWNCFAYKQKSFLVGLGYYSQNTMGKISQSPSGSAGLMGVTSYPLNLKYDYEFMYDWYVSPQLSYTLFPRESAAGSAKTTMLHILFPVGTNLSWGYAGEWDWSFGPGIMQYTTKGAGGTTVLSNGTGTATFALPGDSVKSQTVTLNFGGSLNVEQSRYGLDLIFEGAFSQKRSASVMLSYAYRLGGEGKSW